MSDLKFIIASYIALAAFAAGVAALVAWLASHTPTGGLV